MSSIVFYNSKFNLEYYTIPKCGQTSILKSLAMKAHKLSEVPEDRRIFTVIRNPLDRVISSFLHCRKAYGNRLTRSGGGTKHNKLTKSFHDKDVVKSFDLFLTEIEDNGFFDGHNASQMFFLDGLTTRRTTVPREFDKITNFYDQKS